MNHVLIPIDGSPRSAQSLHAYRSILGSCGSTITLITVREDIDSRSPAILEQMRQESEIMLRRFAHLLEGRTVKLVVRFGLPGEEILNYAHEHHIETIVMTTRTHSMRNALMGSVAVYLVKHSDIPILVVPEKASLE